jgi:hypothetical protein
MTLLAFMGIFFFLLENKEKIKFLGKKKKKA